MANPKISHSFRVAEIFGPTIQGEGVDAGRPAYFVRFGGCDYRCIWCDSMHAVDPEKVKLLPWMTADQIVETLKALPGKYPLVILSGGNPAVWDMKPVLEALGNDPDRSWEVAVETQGTIWDPWLATVDTVVVSPKPPSSGMVTKTDQLAKFWNHLRMSGVRTCLKIVIFDWKDLEYACRIAEYIDPLEIHLSIGTLPTDTRDTLLDRYRDLIELALQKTETLHVPFRIAPQIHVLVWGHVLGV